jgi:hypothetical protein
VKRVKEAVVSEPFSGVPGGALVAGPPGRRHFVCVRSCGIRLGPEDAEAVHLAEVCRVEVSVGMECFRERGIVWASDFCDEAEELFGRVVRRALCELAKEEEGHGAR